MWCEYTEVMGRLSMEILAFCLSHMQSAVCSCLLKPYSNSALQPGEQLTGADSTDIPKKRGMDLTMQLYKGISV